MKNAVRISILVAVITCSVFATTREQRLALFLAGCEVLNEAVLVPPERRAVALRWLIDTTGITPENARKMVLEYRNRPDDWQKLLEAVRAVMLPPAKPAAAPSDTSREAAHGT